jgi:hypothetical protein
MHVIVSILFHSQIEVVVFVNAKAKNRFPLDSESVYFKGSGIYKAGSFCS